MSLPGPYPGRPRQLLPGLPVVSEESAGDNRENLGDSFLMVDPLDGTREFLAGRDEFTVNLAIISRAACRRRHYRRAET